ncbi:MAG: DegT/DnrJ/EryC1/StrS family aminotransferase [bacterium]
MKVPFLDLTRYFSGEREEIYSAVQDTFASGTYLMGERVPALETELKSAFAPKGSGGFVCCNSGTDALTLALLASGVRAGDEVITVSHTAIPTVAAIFAVGGIPVLMDVHPATWVMDPKALPAHISKKTRAIIIVHLYGNAVPYPSIERILKECGREDISIIEDAAQAMGTTVGGVPVGTSARFGAYSFFPTKNVGAFGDGGAVYCRDPEDEVTVRSLRFYGQKVRGEVSIPRGINSRLDELQAAVLRVRLKYFAKRQAEKTLLMRRYREALSGKRISFQEVAEATSPAWHLCVICAERDEDRDDLKKFLSSRGIECMIHYPLPNHLQLGFGLSGTSLPVTESLVGKILSLPFFSGMQEDEQLYIIESINQFLSCAV